MHRRSSKSPRAWDSGQQYSSLQSSLLKRWAAYSQEYAARCIEAWGRLQPSMATKGYVMSHRPLHVIAKEIWFDWKPIHPWAKPYAEALLSLESIHHSYGLDSGRSIVAYFLSNASTWRGDVAKRVKKELKDMIK